MKLQRLYHPFFMYIILIMMILLFVGCAQKKQTLQEQEPLVVEEPPAQVDHSENTDKEEQPPPAFLIHTVSFPGENLSLIAKWYTGAAKNWELVAEYNPQINPNRIFKGDKIRIPIELVEQKEPLPKKFIEKFKNRKKEQTTKDENKTNERDLQQIEEEVTAEDLPLFGPKNYNK